MKIYLAGPDVFRPDALAWGDKARRLCASHGHQALLPLDGVETTAAGIYQANIAQIRAADAVIANLNPFRGCEPDSGTCFEVGFAVALGKPVMGYVDRMETTVERVARLEGRRLDQPTPVDRHGMHVENFGLPLNLMLAVPLGLVIGGLESALGAYADLLSKG
jgi:nucleoside 2-deoxyribosyltransferase